MSGQKSIDGLRTSGANAWRIGRGRCAVCGRPLGKRRPGRVERGPNRLNRLVCADGCESQDRIAGLAGAELDTAVAKLAERFPEYVVRGGGERRGRGRPRSLGLTRERYAERRAAIVSVLGREPTPGELVRLMGLLGATRKVESALRTLRRREAEYRASLNAPVDVNA